MNKQSICPNCGSAKTAKGKLDEWRYLNAFDFAPMAPWSCGDCGHVWEPPAPKWLLVLLLLLGFLVLGLTVVEFTFGTKHLLRRIIFGGMSIVLIVGCIRKLRNRAPITLTPGQKAGSSST